MKIKILYEDANILAIEKPSGIAVHPDGREGPSTPFNKAQGKPLRARKTITDWVLKNYPKTKNVGEDEVFEFKGEKIEIKKPGIVHRLDRDTSGVLLIAKNQKAYEFLKSQFQDREIKKVYVAIVNGFLKNERGIIDKPIGRSPVDFRKYSAGRGARGEMREAITQYRVLSRFEEGKNKFSYLELRPKTGRTHQLRVHMKFLQHPIVGDALYNPEGSIPKGLTRMALHAKSIEFKNLKGGIVKVESKVPEEFENVIS